MPEEKIKGFWSVGRLVIGIVLLVLSLFVLLQACAAGLVNTMEENTGDVGGTAGFIVAVFMIVAGIIAIVTRNSKSKAGPFVAAGLLVLGAIIAFFNSAVFEDLIVWGVISIALGIVFIICGIKTPKGRKE